MKRAVPVALIALACAVPASAATRSASIDAVYGCGAASCGTRVAPGEVVTGSIQADITVTSEDGLEWARLETRDDMNGPWLCLQRWEAGGARSFSASYVWQTHHFPPVTRDWHCDESTPHMHGEPAPNARYELRVIAHDRSGGEAVAPPFALGIENPPAGVVARGASVARAGGVPRARIGWYLNGEPDLVEYRIVRLAPDATRLTIVIDAIDPTRSGCVIDHLVAVTCVDANFHAKGTGGRYAYAVSAFRASVARNKSCVLVPKQPCSASRSSATMAVTIPGTFAGSFPRADATLAPAAPGQLPPGSTQRPSPQPVPSHSGGSPAPASGETSNILWVWIVLAGLLVGTGVFAVRRFRSRT